MGSKKDREKEGQSPSKGELPQDTNHHTKRNLGRIGQSSAERVLQKKGCVGEVPNSQSYIPTRGRSFGWPRKNARSKKKKSEEKGSEARTIVKKMVQQGVGEELKGIKQGAMTNKKKTSKKNKKMRHTKTITKQCQNTPPKGRVHRSRS